MKGKGPLYVSQKLRRRNSLLRNKVFLLKNEKGEWVFPKGVVRKELPNEVALRRIKEEGDIASEIISTAGHTNYEFFSVTRQKPVCNKITWYIMKSNNLYYKINDLEKFTDAGYFDIEEAMKLVTYSQDKSLLTCPTGCTRKLSP